MHYIIAYDVSNDKRRKKLADLFEGYGVRVNYSVFECELSQTQLERILYEIDARRLINKKNDSIRFYHIHRSSLSRSFELGDKPDPFAPLETFI